MSPLGQQTKLPTNAQSKGIDHVVQADPKGRCMTKDVDVCAGAFNDCEIGGMLLQNCKLAELCNTKALVLKPSKSCCKAQIAKSGRSSTLLVGSVCPG